VNDIVEILFLIQLHPNVLYNSGFNQIINYIACTTIYDVLLKKLK